jgi:hypothetical protein
MPARASTSKRLKHALKRSRALTLAAWVAKDRWRGLQARLRPRSAMRIGATHSELRLDESLAYIDGVVADYRRYGGLGPAALAGKRVLEVGPGDNYGVALEMVGDGAAQVVCMDRFAIWRDPDQQRAIYTALIEREPDSGRRARMEAAVTLGAEVRFDPDLISIAEGVAVEEAPATIAPASIDVIVSRAVLAHVWDLDRALDAMDTLVAADGLMAHKVDLSDHGLLTDGGHSALAFLTVRDAIWDRMRRNTGLTNRRLIDSYRAGLTARGYDAELLITRVAGDVGELIPHTASLGEAEMGRARAVIEPIRPRLLPRYRALPDEDLAAAGVFAVARRSSRSS